MTEPLLPGPLWLAGCGNMAGAMLARWLDEGVDPAHVSAIRPSGAPAREGVRVTTECPEDEVPAIVLLGMKPHQLNLAAPALAPILDRETVLVSILAGVEIASLRARFPAPRTIIRAMPNLPVRVGKGVVGLFSDSEDVAARAIVTRLMAVLGHAEWFEDEESFQLAGALTGAGPAFLFRFIDALGAAAAQLGLPYEQAARLALKTVEGAAALAAASPDDPETLARKVASPGGTTEAGLRVLDEDRALPDLLERTVSAARLRGLEMAGEARRESD
ncbi:MAG TPA: pyrroline-5-carboxylate reductase dimerization domain-containing protein [Allosphingosinicella sp.]|nr:pyrroline-5-carboxylate reductase dimerization domain-containing protein [Allosphingosinicella sp.]